MANLDLKTEAMPRLVFLAFSQGGLMALFCATFAAIGIAHFIAPRAAKAFWVAVFFPLGIGYDYEEPALGYQLIGGIFIVIAAIVGYYAV